MPARPDTGRSLVTRRAIVDIVRAAVLGSYGVTGVDAGPFERLLGRLGFREPGIRVRLDRGLEIDLHLTVAHGVPVAEVARQVDSAIRYGLRRALERDVRRLAVHVGGLRYQPASMPPTKDGPPTRENPPAGESSPAPDPAAGDPTTAAEGDGSRGSGGASDGSRGSGSSAGGSASEDGVNGTLGETIEGLDPGGSTGSGGRARRRRRSGDGRASA